MTQPSRLPEPALVVLVGASGAGKSTWARARFRADEIVSSDALRAVVGSGPADLDASADAFDLLDRIVSARVGRRLTTVVDTLGTDAARRLAQLELARRHGVAAVAVLVDAPPTLTRERNARRDRPVPARVLSDQHRRTRQTQALLDGEGWDLVLVVDGQADPVAGDGPDVAPAGASAAPAPDASTGIARRPIAPPAPFGRHPSGRPSVLLQLSTFPWGADPLDWLESMVLAAADAGLDGVALMDHLVQIPQVGRVWDPIPEPWVTLGALAALRTGLHLGTLVSPVTFREPGITAKASATLDVLTSGRSFLGLGAGWWDREHAGFGLELPAPAQRLDLLERAIETIRALWSPGTKPFEGQRISLPETTSYPRPVGSPPIIVGGTGRRTLSIAGRLADACNVPSDERLLADRVAVVRTAADLSGRTPEEVMTTVLDLPVVGRDREDVWRKVERHRGRVAAATYAARHRAGTPSDHRERYERLQALGVSAVFVAPVGLATPDDVHTLAALVP